ncbi:MAG: hypothetical protein HGA62_08895 [Chlorobiaceae bacterium]|nr:hypothetical protein [Chlorobiaceae bacterium]NTV60823.1 hypothetical protein [Chlorobiaceae bacterium]
MPEGTNKDTEPRLNPDKPVEKTGFPLPGIRPAVEELRFIYRESLRLSMNILTEIENMLKKFRDG